MVSIKTQGLGPGLHFATEYAEDCTGIAVTKGDIVQFDLTSAANLTPGDSASGFVKFIQPVTNGLIYGFYGVAMATAAAGEKVRILVKGRVEAQLATTTAKHLGLVPANGASTLAAAAASGREKIVAVSLETGSASVPTYVVFDGINGFGPDAA